MDRLISVEEVKKHKNSNSVWIIIHNDVYDVTSFLEEHPGGEDSLLDVAGKDGTQGFEDVNHSEDARELLNKYKIGTLPPDEKINIVNSCCKLKPRKRSRSRSRCSLCSAASCPHIPRTDKAEKTWRTYDGSPSRQSVTSFKSEYKVPTTPITARRVQSIVVPRERTRRQPPRPRGYPCGSSGYLKWALLALGGAIVLGVVLKKYLK